VFNVFFFFFFFGGGIQNEEIKEGIRGIPKEKQKRTNTSSIVEQILLDVKINFKKM
jgi:hypothetical protein